MKNILIIGCGLLGSSLLRRIFKKKLAKKVFVYEKSKKNITKFKKLKLPGVLVKRPEDVISQSELIILCTPMSEYKKIIIKINDYLTSKHVITDLGSSKLRSEEIIRKNLKKIFFGLPVILLLDQKSVDPKMGDKIFLTINGVF